MILKPYPAAERPSLRLKVTAADVLKGRRQQWGYGRKWEGNYLVNVSQLRFLNIIASFQQMMFADVWWFSLSRSHEVLDFRNIDDELT